MLLSNIAPHQDKLFNAYKMTSKQALMKYLQQCLFSPPKRMLIRAIQQNHFPTWPGLTTDAVRKYLPDTSPATNKGHMKQQRQGIRSTTRTKTKDNATKEAETFADFHPPIEKEELNQMFCGLAVIDKKCGTVCTDFTRNFPIQSSQGNMLVFVMYDWSSNVILATPVPDTKGETIIATFRDNIIYLEARGFKPSFNIIDNIASKAVQNYLENKTQMKIQLVEPHNHRINAAKRAIQTFKNHMIVGLCTASKDFPSLLWDYLIPQAQDSLNMLRTSRVHPKVSAYHVLEGVHDFNRVP
jgi:hypothetical protein